MDNAFNRLMFNRVYSNVVTTKSQIITFGGMDIRDAVPDCKVIDIVISAPGIETRSLTTERHGSMFVCSRRTVRTVTITVELPLSRDTYARNVQRLQAWACSEESKELVLTCYPDRKLSCTCTGFGSFSQRDWWQPIEIVFTAWNPFFTSIQAKSAKVGESFTVQGDAPPLLTIDHAVSTPITGAKWTIDEANYIKLLDSKTISTGTVTIDFENMVVTHSGQSVMADLSIKSRFGEIKPGTHIITGPDGGVITWYERWL